jgi:nitrate reductase NapE
LPPREKSRGPDAGASPTEETGLEHIERGRRPEDDAPSTYQEELRTFLFLTVVTAPILAVAIVGGYGFIVWMYQLFTGDLPG